MTRESNDCMFGFSELVATCGLVPLRRWTVVVCAVAMEHHVDNRCTTGRPLPCPCVRRRAAEVDTSATCIHNQPTDPVVSVLQATKCPDLFARTACLALKLRNSCATPPSDQRLM